MAAYGRSFESARNIEEKKESKRRAREELLAQAKEEYEKEERRKEQRRLRGEDTWMLSDVTERLEQIEQENSGKKKKKDKKSKKEKKKKSKKNKSEKTEDWAASSSSDSEGKWVEAAPAQPVSDKKAWKIQKESPTKESPMKETGSEVQRDSWMTLDFMSLKATSTAALRAERQKEKTLERERVEAVEKEKMLARELNPFWKDGGSGLPPEEGDVTSVKKVQVVEDGGLGWLRKSLQRMKEQSEREKRSLEDIVAERYGSMEIFQNKMEAAEKASSQKSWGEQNDRREGWRKSKYHDQASSRYPKPDGSNEYDRRSDHYSDDRRSDRSSYRQNREYNSDKTNEEGKDSRSYRPESGRRQYLERRLEEATDGRGAYSRLKDQFLKPSEDKEESGAAGLKLQRDDRGLSSQNSTKSRFLKPPDDEPPPLWKKMAANHSKEENRESRRGDQDISTKNEKQQDTESSVDHQESPEDVQPSSSRLEARKPSVKILTEEDMNKLGAKIVKAEIMGNTELAEKLKAQLEEARQQKINKAQDSERERRDVSERSGAGEDQEILLLKTDQSGRAWPVNSMAGPAEPKGGRRKRQLVETHVDKERVRYFQDDDHQSLQDLVKREKMGTAEDQNKLYLRMAAKLREKTDQEYYTLDDMFVSKVAKKERANEEEDRERQQAIAEHRKLAARMEKCPYCFGNAELPKHLIIAIGVKVYLCLPNHLSLTEGHCLIVPLQHHTAVTLLDEDIWDEIQMFRKTLVKMFADQGLDCVFLETNMNLKKRFHLVYECIPLPKEVGDMAPIYFKKAIMESDEEWSMNKKLIDLSMKDVRRSVPKGLPYFSVDFGLQGGFAHVIEDHNKFPHYFGKEIIGGMLDLEPRIWRKAVRENFDDQRKKVLQFSQWWKPFDFTKTKES
ncbi:CWF19-like protein 2 isoform X2 [Hyla sarda]|uniref:CWF19-like protein 2 isoform X2 n=1 Tax=Hyla sarda TaxID=327740 RepID=UPI0024C405E3|nr:CWF19-like protein 2 isoform X2 [Hyla sarda]